MAPEKGESDHGAVDSRPEAWRRVVGGQAGGGSYVATAEGEGDNGVVGRWDTKTTAS
jgi:hypothetical protein